MTNCTFKVRFLIQRTVMEFTERSNGFVSVHRASPAFFFSCSSFSFHMISLNTGCVLQPQLGREINVQTAELRQQTNLWLVEVNHLLCLQNTLVKWFKSTEQTSNILSRQIRPDSKHLVQFSFSASSINWVKSFFIFYFWAAGSVMLFHPGFIIMQCSGVWEHQSGWEQRGV